MEQSGFQNGLFYSKWVKTCKTTCMAPRQTPGFTLNKNRCRNITHCYSFITRVLLAFSPIQYSQKINIISIPESPTMTHSCCGGWEEGGLDALLTGRFPCARPEWQSCPIRRDSCWRQLRDVFPRVCHLLVLTMAACLHVRRLTCQPRIWAVFFLSPRTYFYVFQQVVFCTCECSFAIFECTRYIIGPCVHAKCVDVFVLWHPPPLQ